MKIDEMITAVKDHAIMNYDEDGWDSVVECWSDEDIRRELQDQRVRSANGAIRVIGECVKLYASNRSEIEATRF
jgi:hypothetical protein